MIQTNEWQPRLGVVWDPLGDGTSKVYAFAGRFSYGLPTDLAIRVYGAEMFVVNTYNFDPVGVDSGPERHRPRRPRHIQGSSIGEPVDAGLKGIVAGRADVGVEKTYRAARSRWGSRRPTARSRSAIEDRCDLDYNAAGERTVDLRAHESGLGRPDLPRRLPLLHGLDDDFDNCATPGEQLYGAPPMPAAKRIYRGIELLARKSFVAEPLAPGLLRLLVPARQLRRRGQRELYGARPIPASTRTSTIRSSGTTPTGASTSTGRTSCASTATTIAPFGLSVGLQTWLRSGAPLNQYGYFNGVLRLRRSTSFRKGSAGRLPMQWEANLTLSYPIRVGPVTATLQALRLQPLQQSDPRLAQDADWIDSAAGRLPGHDLRSQPGRRPTPNYGMITGSLRAPVSFARRSACRSEPSRR